MNLDRLNTFTIAAESLNFTQAARQLQLSQPAISQQIRDLEVELGVQLFERRGRSLLLTAAGDRLRYLALDLLKNVQSVEEQLDEYRGLEQGNLLVGATNTIGIYLLPHVFGKFSLEHPGVRTSLKVTDTAGIVQGLQDGSLDMALIEEDIPPGQIYGWEKEHLVDDRLCLIAHPDHPWAQRSVEVHEFDQAQFILRQPESKTRQFLMDRIAEAGFDPRRLAVRFEHGHTEGIKRTVMAGLGVGFVSCYSIVRELKTGALVRVEVKDLNIQRPMCLLRPSDERLNKPQQLFVEILRRRKENLPPELRLS
ncbi:MAG: LysR substrate-binding domain-containing protein [Bacteroidota bacterium]